MKGDLWAWGVNNYGQLGNGTTTASRQPTAVLNTQLKSAVAIACGWSHSLAIDSEGALWAWGLNTSGQLGIGSTGGAISAPVKVVSTGLTSPVTAIACGYAHSIAIDSNNTVWAWGQNTDGQLGIGNTTNQNTPRATSLTAATAIACGFYHTLAIAAGVLWAWGQNWHGQLGTGGISANSIVPTRVLSTNLKSAVIIAGGLYHSLAIDANGRLWTWGANNKGQQGNGTTSPYIAQPTAGTNINSAAAIAGGYDSSFAIDKTGSLWAWGYNNYGQLGNGSTADKLVPTAVDKTNLTSAIALTQGYYHTVAIDTQKKLWAWGWNNYGQLGDGTFDNKYTPTAVIDTKLAYAAAVAVGNGHTLAIEGEPQAPPTPVAARGIPF